MATYSIAEPQFVTIIAHCLHISEGKNKKLTYRLEQGVKQLGEGSRMGAPRPVY